MIAKNALICTPDIDSLTQASERAPLSLLAAAALCARNALLAQHHDELQALGADDSEDEPIPAVTLVAMQVMDHIDDLMHSLVLYEAALHDHLRAKLYQENPF